MILADSQHGRIPARISPGPMARQRVNAGLKARRCYRPSDSKAHRRYAAHDDDDVGGLQPRSGGDGGRVRVGGVGRNA